MTKRLSSDRRAPWCFVIRLARRRLANVTRPLFLLLIVLPALHAEDNVSVLGSKPRWGVLEHYQQTITHDEFAHLINDVYCTHGFASDLIEIDDNTARILINREAQKFFTLRFAANSAERKPVPRLWHPAKSLPHGAAGETAFRCKDRARPGPSRRQLGKDGGAVVSSRREQTGSGRRFDLARGAIVGPAITRTRR